MEINEDVKKYFRITNRFIQDCIDAGGKILIHSNKDFELSIIFLIAFQMHSENINLKTAIAVSLFVFLIIRI